MNLFALIILILFFLGTIPIWPHSREYGYARSGAIGLFIGVVVVLYYMGVIPAN